MLCVLKRTESQWDGSFEDQKHMLKLMGKKAFTILHWKYLLIKTYDPLKQKWTVPIDNGGKVHSA